MRAVCADCRSELARVEGPGDVPLFAPRCQCWDVKPCESFTPYNGAATLLLGGFVCSLCHFTVWAHR